MGRDKAWLRVGHETLVQRVTRVARGAARWVVVVAAPGQRLPALSEVRRVDDPPSRVGGGPVAGVLTGLEALARIDVELAYLGSVDAVRLTTRHVTFVLDLLQDDPTLDAVVPETRGPDRRIVHGLSGAVRVRAALATASALELSGRGAAMRTLYERLSARRLRTNDLPDPSVLRACNTPEQWYEAVAEVTHDE
jgi:molybdopterin-guanine dinucleotide biosynthesis protein A